MKITRKFRSKKGFLSNIAGNEIPKIGGYVYYIPELWKIISEISPGLYRVESCLSRTWKITTLEHRAPANIRSHALHTEVQLQNQCMQLEKLKSTNSSLTKGLVELRQELDNYCNKTKKATEEDLVKWNAKCEALQDNLKTTAARNAEQEQPIEVLKQEFADLKVKAAKKGVAIKNMEKMNDQLKSEHEQLQPVYGQRMPKKNSLIDR